VTWRLHSQGIGEASVAVAVLSVWLRKRLADTPKELLKPRRSSFRLTGDFFLVFSCRKLEDIYIYGSVIYHLVHDHSRKK
jgi:hypothetical protein